MDIAYYGLFGHAATSLAFRGGKIPLERTESQVLIAYIYVIQTVQMFSLSGRVATHNVPSSKGEGGTEWVARSRLRCQKHGRYIAIHFSSLFLMLVQLNSGGKRTIELGR